jgi:hypothetical protein
VKVFKYILLYCSFYKLIFSVFYCVNNKQIIGHPLFVFPIFVFLAFALFSYGSLDIFFFLVHILPSEIMESGNYVHGLSLDGKG